MKTLTKVYERHDVARQVVIELEAAGFPSSSISLLANKVISDDTPMLMRRQRPAPEPEWGRLLEAQRDFLRVLACLLFPVWVPLWPQAGLHQPSWAQWPAGSQAAWSEP